MRDDICRLFRELNSNYEKKLNLYTSLARNTEECNFHIVSGNIAKIDEKLEESNHLITRIDAGDFEISQAKSEICRLSGIEYHNFENYFFTSSPENSEVKRTEELLGNIKKLMRTSLENRKEMIKKIHTENTLLSASIDSLSRTRALNTRFRIMNY